MTVVDDRIRIGRAFHRHAGEYDQYASVQKRVVARLAQLVAIHQKGTPDQVLDIGCGTGAMLATLQVRYPRTSLCGLDLAFNMAKRSKQILGVGGNTMLVNGAAEQLPFREKSFDLVVSASTLQWVDRLDICFDECHRVLRDAGLLCMAFFCGRTFWELQESYRDAVTLHFGAQDVRMDRLHRFREIEEVQEIISGCGYGNTMICRETEMEYHSDVSEILRSIKAIGATTTTVKNETSGGLGGRQMLTDMASIYHSRFKKNGLVPVTYEVVYVVATRSTD